PDQTVVTYDTVIEVTNPNLKLKPGMTANVSIIITHHDNVLKIHNAALRFRPPKNIEAAKAVVTNKTDIAEPKSEKKTDPAKYKKEKKEKRKSERTVYVLQNGALQPIKLKLGITDGRETEVIEGLKEGDSIVVDTIESRENTTLTSRMLAVFKRRE